MDEQLTKMRAASMLLERGVRFKISDAPFLLRLLRLNRITITGLKAGTIARFSLLIYKHSLDVRIADREYLYEKIEIICQALAVAMLNSRLRIAILSSALSRLLMWKIKYVTLVEMFVLLVEIASAADFTSFTAWMCQQTTTLMTPRTGHKETGS